MELARFFKHENLFTDALPSALMPQAFGSIRATNRPFFLWGKADRSAGRTRYHRIVFRDGENFFTSDRFPEGVMEGELMRQKIELRRLGIFAGRLRHVGKTTNWTSLGQEQLTFVATRTVPRAG